MLLLSPTVLPWTSKPSEGLEAAAATGQTTNICVFNTARKVKKKTKSSKRISLASKCVSHDQTKAAKALGGLKGRHSEITKSHFKVPQDMGTGDSEPDVSGE